MTLTLSPSPTATGAALDARPALARLRGGVLRAVRAMQYARLREAMARLTDDQLAEIGLSRADIPRHARACIYPE